MSLAEQLSQADRCADAARFAVDAAKQLAKELLQSKFRLRKKIGRISSCSFLLKLLLPKIYSVLTGSEFQPLLMKIAPPDGLASTFKPA